MKILVVNAGSSSLKYQLFDMQAGTVLAKGNCERIGIDGLITHKRPEKSDYKTEAAFPDHRTAISFVLNLLTDKTYGVIESVNEILGVGHRFAHGGEKLRKSCVIGDQELAYLESIVGLNPLHGPPAISGLKACKEVLPNVKHVGVFDTSYYSEMEDYAYIPVQSSADRAAVQSLEIGDRVTHATFGQGEILSVKPMGADKLIEVVFDSVGTKKLMGTYAKLKRVDD